MLHCIGSYRCLPVVLGILSLWAVAAQAADRFVPSSDGQEVTDTKTGLIWRRCAEGMTFKVNTCVGSYNTFTHEAALKRATGEATRTGVSWRLPNVKELASIVDRSRSSPAIDSKAFPATPSTWFWSSSPYVGNSDYAWDVYFSYGSVYGSGRSTASAVRLVRGG